MTKNDIVKAISVLYPEGFDGFNTKFPTPRNYEEYVKSVDSKNKKMYTKEYPIHSKEELKKAALLFSV